MFDTKPYEDKIAQAFRHFEDELKKVRTGRAHPGMLDGVVVEAYGSRLPLNQVANVTAPEAQMLLGIGRWGMWRGCLQKIAE